MELNSIGTAVVMAYRGDGWCVRFRLLDLVAKRHSLARKPRLACYLPGDASNVAWPEKPTGEQDVRNASSVHNPGTARPSKTQWPTVRSVLQHIGSGCRSRRLGPIFLVNLIGQ